MSASTSPRLLIAMASRAMRVQVFEARPRSGRFPRTGYSTATPITDNPSTNGRTVFSSSVHNLPATTTLSATLEMLPPVSFQAEKLGTKGTLAGLRSTRHTPPRYTCRSRRSSLCSTEVERASNTTRPTGRGSTDCLQLRTQLVSRMAGPATCVARRRRRAFSSSSDDTSSKKAEGAIEEEEEKVDVPPVAEAEFIEPDDLTHQQPRHVQIEMPAITDVSVPRGACGCAIQLPAPLADFTRSLASIHVVHTVVLQAGPSIKVEFSPQTIYRRSRRIRWPQNKLVSLYSANQWAGGQATGSFSEIRRPSFA